MWDDYLFFFFFFKKQTHTHNYWGLSMLGGKEIVGRTWEGDRESGLEEREEKIVKYGP